MVEYFQYGNTEIEYLKSRDKKLADCIDKIGHIYRRVDTDLFSSVVHHIIGQQISTKAQETVWKRMQSSFERVDCNSILNASVEQLQSCGMTFKKVEYIKDFASKVNDGVVNLDEIEQMDDGKVVEVLSSLKGVGVWTAEMLLLFCLERPNVFSYGDLAIHRGLRMVYHHRNIDKKVFEKFRKRFTPYCSVASLYLWAVAGGAIEELKDPKPKSKN